MAGGVLPMKAMAAVMAFVVGERVNVSMVCRDAGITRKTFYKYVARCRVEGLAGFEPRSRRPGSFPNTTLIAVEDAVVAERARLLDAGCDAGPVTIRCVLADDERFQQWRLPSVATIHRILQRRGLIEPAPKKRPKSSWRRFEAPAPNEWWQIDATDWLIATGIVRVFNIIDDHSRLLCRSRCVNEATGPAAWTTFCQAAQRWGLPAGVLSDNGLCFSGRLRGMEVLFEANLRDAGVRPFTGRPYHPQTTGKVERFQQTLKRWLRRQDEIHGLAADLAELQARLDTFAVYYNEQRLHQGIGRVTPLSRWHATPAATASDPLPHPGLPARAVILTVDPAGLVRFTDIDISIGVDWAGCDVTLLIDHNYATVFHDGHLVRHLKIDHSRRYQPSGRPRGGPRRTRHLAS